MGNGDFDVGNKNPTRKPDRPVERISASDLRIDRSNPAKRERPKVCGSMVQQSCDSGNQSAPQKFVQLVGCRDPKARPEPWVRPRAPR